MLAKFWKYSEGQLTRDWGRFLFTRLPNVAVFDSNDTCVAFVFLKPGNGWGLIHVEPEYRRQGLALILTRLFYEEVSKAKAMPSVCSRDSSNMATTNLCDKYMGENVPGFYRYFWYEPKNSFGS